MREKQMFKILKRILDKENIENLKKHIIYPEGDGYVMYGEYLITPTKSGDFSIEKYHTYTVKKFNSLRNAIIWTTLDKSNKIMYAKKIEELDIMLASTESHIELHKRSLKFTKNTTSMSLAHIKLNEESLKKIGIVEELEYFALMSKSLQDRKFSKVTK